MVAGRQRRTHGARVPTTEAGPPLVPEAVQPSVDAGLVVGYELAGRDDPGQQPIRYILHRHGLAVSERHRCWTATCAVVQCPCPGLQAITVPSFEWTAPRVPWAILERAIRLFRHVMATRRTEALAWVLYDETASQYRLVVPPQTATAASVCTDAIPDEGMVLAAELHSHPGEMDHHSSVDNDDEAGRLVLSGVVSHLSGMPRLALRAVTTQGHVPVPVTAICDVPPIAVQVPLLACQGYERLVAEAVYGDPVSHDPDILADAQRVQPPRKEAPWPPLFMSRLT